MQMTPHEIESFSSFTRSLVRAGEGFKGLPYAVNAGRPSGDHTITIGFGYTMVRKGRTGWARYENLTKDLKAALGITSLDQDMQDVIKEVARALNARNYTKADEQVEIFSILWDALYGPISETQAELLSEQEANHKKVHGKLGVEPQVRPVPVVVELAVP